MAEERSLSLDQLHTPHGDPWMRYVQGVIAQYDQHVCAAPGSTWLSYRASRREAGYPAVPRSSWRRAPPGGGNRSDLNPAERIQASVQAEREMAGVPCGIMDQTVVELAASGQALLLDCRIRQRGQSLSTRRRRHCW